MDYLQNKVQVVALLRAALSPVLARYTCILYASPVCYIVYTCIHMVLLYDGCTVEYSSMYHVM